MASSNSIVVSGLNIFPIKSCRACKVDKIVIDSYGVVGDRRFMLVDGNGRFTSQRKFPRLALVEVKWVEGEEGRDKILKINAPGMNELTVVPVYQGERLETTVWNDTVMTIDQGREASDWFSRYLELSAGFIRLVSSAEQTPGYSRMVTNLPPSLRGKLPPAFVHLGDGGPVSMISNESLADLNGRLKERTEGREVPLNRFRMNIEITGCDKPFEEDDWLLIKISDIPFLVYVANEVRIAIDNALKSIGHTYCFKAHHLHAWQRWKRLTLIFLATLYL